MEATHTWTGDALGRGPYQAVTALNSLRYRLGRYPVVARRCLASYTPRLAETELQVEGGNVGPNVGSAADAFCLVFVFNSCSETALATVWEEAESCQQASLDGSQEG